MADARSGLRIRFRTDSILRLTMNCCWLEFWWLDRIFSWLHLTADSSSGSWFRLRTEFLSAADSSSSWFYRAADSSSASLTQLGTDLCFNRLKDSFCKIHHFSGLFTAAWFQLPVIQSLAAASRNLSLKKPEEAWRNFKTLVDNNSSSTGRLTPMPPDISESVRSEFEHSQASVKTLFVKMFHSLDPSTVQLAIFPV